MMDGNQFFCCDIWSFLCHDIEIYQEIHFTLFYICEKLLIDQITHFKNTFISFKKMKTFFNPSAASASSILNLFIYSFLMTWKVFASGRQSVSCAHGMFFAFIHTQSCNFMSRISAACSSSVVPRVWTWLSSSVHWLMIAVFIICYSLQCLLTEESLKTTTEPLYPPRSATYRPSASLWSSFRTSKRLFLLFAAEMKWNPSEMLHRKLTNIRFILKDRIGVFCTFYTVYYKLQTLYVTATAFQSILLFFRSLSLFLVYFSVKLNSQRLDEFHTVFAFSFIYL